MFGNLDLEFTRGIGFSGSITGSSSIGGGLARLFGILDLEFTRGSGSGSFTGSSSVGGIVDLGVGRAPLARGGNRFDLELARCMGGSTISSC